MTAFKTLATRYTKTATELKDMGEDAEGAAETTAKLRSEMKALSGVDILDSTGQFKDMFSLYDELADKWSSLDSMAQSRIGELLAGTRQRSIFNALMNSWDIAEKTLATATSSETEGSATRELENWNKGIEASVEHFKASFQDMSQTVINSDFIKTVVDGGTAALDIFTSLVDTVGLLPTILGGAGITSFFKNFGNFANVARIDDAVTALTGGFTAAGDITKSLNALDKAEDVASALKTAGIDKQYAKIALSGSKWAHQADDIADAMADTAISTNTISSVGARIRYTFSGIKQSAIGIGKIIAANPLLAGGAAVAGVAGVVAIGAAIYKQYKEHLIEQADEATEAWEQSTATLEEQIEKVRTLRTEIDSGNLNDAQILANKQQIYAIQQQIVDSYGQQAEGIDLVNGSLEHQIDILNDISQAEAQRSINDNYNAYEDARREMENQNRDYRVASQVPKEIVDMVKDLNIEGLNPMLNEDGVTYDIIFHGDATSADTAIHQFMDALDELEKSYDPDSTNFSRYAREASEAIAKNQKEVLDKYQQNYESYLEQQTYAAGGGKYLSEYEKAVNDYNTALAVGTPEAVHEARTALEEASAAKDKFLSGDGKGLDTTPFDNLTDKIDTSGEKIFDYQEAMSTFANNNGKSISDIKKSLKEGGNQFADFAEQIGADYNELRKAGLTREGLEEMFTLPQADDNLVHRRLMKIASAMGLVGEDGEVGAAGVDKLAVALENAGVIVKPLEAVMVNAVDSFDDFAERATNAFTQMDTINAALAKSFASGGLSAAFDKETGKLTGDVGDLMAVFEDLSKHGLEGYDPEQLFLRTATGVKVNTEALRALQAQQENLTRLDFARQQAELQKQLAEAMASGNQAQIDSINNQLEMLKLMESAYDGATSAYQKWLNAQAGGEAGDIYDNIQSTALSRGDELLKEGLVGTNEFRAIAQLVSGQDLSTASISEVIDAYGRLDEQIGTTGYTIRDFFAEGVEGSENFVKAVDALGKGYVTLGEDGSVAFNNINLKQLADELGTSVDVVEASLNKIKDRGGEITYLNSEQESQLDELNNKVDSARQALEQQKEAAKQAGQMTETLNNAMEASDFDLGSLNTVDELQAKASELEGAIEEVNNSTLEPDVKDEMVQQLNNELNAVNDKIKTINGASTSAPLQIADVQNAYSTLDQLQSKLAQVNAYNATASVKVNVQDDAEIQSLASQIAALDEDVQISIGIDQENVGDVDAIVSQISAEPVQIPVEFQTPGSVDTGSTESVDVTVNYKGGEPPEVPDATATVNYELGTTPQEIPDAQGTANYDLGDSPESVPDASGVANFTLGSHPTTAPTITGTANYTLGSVPTMLPPATQFVLRIPIGGKADGTMTSITKAHADGTLRNVVNLRPALANGKVALDKDEIALVNEVGQESLVRQGKWMLLPPGIHQEALKKGDIIFNAEQTASLLKTGRAMGKGKAYANGTLSNAYASGVSASGTWRLGGYGGASSSGGGGATYNPPVQAAQSVANSAEDTAKSTSEAADKADDFKETLDEIEILLDRVDREIEHIDRTAQGAYNTFTSRNSAISKELGVITTQINNQMDGYKRYIEQANSVGLDDVWAQKVRDGAINIEEITDEDLWDKIQEYQEWLILSHLAQQCVMTILLNCWETLRATTLQRSDEICAGVTG